ncbi:MAG: hypothetical protein A2137_00495 [Chloroflexi bacterium RBG_16_58_8]|nr:MAG: hypothetical protein A2137_00495 [Chloroflexi bacterium RBG_16_58_8]HJX14025.1 hypothetical protein [Dehalococcoidales bacterium]
MKGLKLSKTGWLILSAGLFIVILAGLGLTRSQQLKDQTKADADLTLSTTKLDKLQFADLQQKYEDLQQKTEESQAQLKEAKDRLRQTVVSVDVVDEFFKIAEYSKVTVISLNNSPRASGTLDGVGLAATSIDAQVKGDVATLIDFIINLNNGYAAGYVKSANINVETVSFETSGNAARASIMMTIYSYEGS